MDARELPEWRQYARFTPTARVKVRCLLEKTFRLQRRLHLRARFDACHVSLQHPPAAHVDLHPLDPSQHNPTRIEVVRLHLTDTRSGTKINDYKFPVALTWLADEPPLRETAERAKEWQQATNPPHAHGAEETAGAVAVAGW
jgi:hypothetical protein